MAARGFGHIRLAAIAGAVVVTALLALVVTGNVAYRRSFDTGRPLERRLADARLARCLTPWDRARASRALMIERWVYGRNLLYAGDYSAAVNVLRLAYRADVGNRPLLALFKRAQQIEDFATTRKAHLQHGHEGVGSTLRPQDIER